ncbi:hypothetical protein EDE15_1054 [Edaphobacter aggregans]|uniref:Uncharacterized protein n=1 Tax=Edaphobacter aggregans TaxID=570835 RepID=A0A428MFJ1_9BACT|nr:hypothetical protein [Edaphobacter aggregans]RSL15563.1 hypothetical protein EDE15_1054 [Edaphobacter aggregans]
MSIVLIKTVADDVISDYFSGDPTNCPPIPEVGHFIEGSFGKGQVSKVEHIVDSSLYTINLHFTNTERYYDAS